LGETKAAFLFVAPNAEPARDRAVIKIPSVLELTVVGARNYEEAAAVSKELVEEGNEVIELCAGFGHIGVAEIVKAVEGKAKVGAVRFDAHPAMAFKSGDDVFVE
jgi:hypothetical protein